IVDKNGRVFAVLVGNPPNDPSWESVHKTAASLMEQHGSQVKMRDSDVPSRRNVKKYLSAGYSFGGGQKVPQPFAQKDPMNKLIIDELLSSASFQRISGHLNAAFATWGPRLHRLYHHTLEDYASLDPSFSQCFPQTAFAAATFNFDTQTATTEHLDYLNYLYGWCGVTALGSYNYTKRGHLILWDIRLIIEFPPGTSILLPSAYIRHSNTSISSGEKRYSFTQYSAGGLFRYAQDGMRSRVSMSSVEKDEKEQQARREVSEGVKLYSTLDELARSVQ
ncbi:hypothetical protein K435DRAFT_677098, partial [Dendrothele bispora CBS 962.96]